MKKELVLILCIISLITIVYAQENKISVTTTKEAFLAGENITIKVSLLDSNNNPVNDNVQLTLENADKTIKIEKTISSNKLEEINLGESALSGYWTVAAAYENMISKSIFTIETNELIKFELNENTLTITNIGNTRYTKSIQILIDKVIGIKDVDLNVGEKISFRLIAPKGTYNIEITDGKTTLKKGGISLTGEAIGVLDDRIKNPAPITGARLEGSSEGKIFNFIKNNGIAYIFVLAIIGAVILMAIERKYRRKVK